MPRNNPISGTDPGCGTNCPIGGFLFAPPDDQAAFSPIGGRLEFQSAGRTLYRLHILGCRGTFPLARNSALCAAERKHDDL